MFLVLVAGLHHFVCCACIKTSYLRPTLSVVQDTFAEIDLVGRDRHIGVVLTASDVYIIDLRSAGECVFTDVSTDDRGAVDGSICVEISAATEAAPVVFFRSEAPSFGASGQMFNVVGLGIRSLCGTDGH